jgi:hypothetical protein
MIDYVDARHAVIVKNRSHLQIHLITNDDQKLVYFLRQLETYRIKLDVESDGEVVVKMTPVGLRYRIASFLGLI